MDTTRVQNILFEKCGNSKTSQKLFLMNAIKEMELYDSISKNIGREVYFADAIAIALDIYYNRDPIGKAAISFKKLNELSVCELLDIDVSLVPDSVRAQHVPSLTLDPF